MIQMILVLLLTALLATISIRYAIIYALTNNIADHPGGHKQHDTITPFVGGIGILIAFFIALIVLFNNQPEFWVKWLALGFAAIIIFVIGFIDDIFHLNYKIRFFAQGIVALIMIFMGGVQLSELGTLISNYQALELGLFAIPLTMFATIGGINALNMIDGIDGLAGTLSWITLLLISILAFLTGDQANTTLAIALVGGVSGFLYFNLRYPTQNRARVFLGDNGSMLLGFLFAWLLVDLSQGPHASMTPVTAIWLFAIPLMDTVTVMLRRIWLRQSPFVPDHNHLHHILLHAGLRIEDTVFVIGTLHLMLGSLGLAGLYLGVPDSIMFFSFLLIYSGYFYLTQHPWYIMSSLRHLHNFLGLIPTDNYGVFLGSYSARETETLVKMVCKELGPSVDSWVHVVEQQSSHDFAEKRYSVAVNIRLSSTDYVTDEEISQYIAKLSHRMMDRWGIRVRQFIKRNIDNDRRVKDIGNPLGGNFRVSERRSTDTPILMFEAMFDKFTIEQSNHTEESISEIH
ncbi:MAG: undecaprenyl/decaprenyl-phosphate alpha-N-acetylglucosaminyl 1-phosphate transferase [Nitrosomonas sp.]|nr:undecaprenyl/decaprenyl-phosphate alpha-N-acetylglucosaminyl 1-phosphate transferase [Nitrosomonas sp.]